MPEIKGIAIAPVIMGPLEARDTVAVAVDTGIEGDARGRKRQRQVSILFEEDWQDALADVGGGDLDWKARRANLLVTGMRSPRHEGGIFSIGDVRLEVVMETDPCEVMEKTRSGLQAALTPDWRGGVCCRVLSGGTISLGDSITYEDGVSA